MPRRARLLMLFGGLALAALLLAGPASATHPRPKGGPWNRLSLVPAYSPCTAPNSTHGPPLSFPSCRPPAKISPHLTMGTPDANGAPANSIGVLNLMVWVGAPGGPDDSDVGVTISLEDVRCVPPLAVCGNANAAGGLDYTGNLGFAFRIRPTDHWNAVAPGGGTDPATMQETTMQAAMFGSCSQTASIATGSSCTLGTSLNSVVPGSIKDGKRMIAEIDDVRVYDGGADGDATTSADNAVFLRPGIFVP